MWRQRAARESAWQFFEVREAPGQETGLGGIWCSIACRVLQKRSSLSHSRASGAISQDAEYGKYFHMQEKSAREAKYFSRANLRLERLRKNAEKPCSGAEAQSERSSNVEAKAPTPLTDLALPVTWRGSGAPARESGCQRVNRTGWMPGRQEGYGFFDCADLASRRWRCS